MFDPRSRYHSLDVVTLDRTGRDPVRYVRRRFLPDPAGFDPLGTVTVVQGDRLDLIAARTLGDPLLYWRICDANGALCPDDLVATAGTALSIPQPKF